MMPVIKKSGYIELIIAAIALLNVIAHLVFSYNLEYHRDELLYFSLGSHPAFGYATVPPMIGWVAWIMQQLFGNSIFAVRLFPALMSGIMIYLVSALVKELGGSSYARILAAIGSFISIFGLRSFLLFQPVHIDLIMWTLILYFMLKYVNTEERRYLVILGAVVGFTLLNKYLVGILLFSLLIVVPFTKHRKVFRDKYFWYGVLAGFLVFLPNFIWQIVNGLPVINHFIELKETQLVNVDGKSFLIEQLLIPGAASFLTVAGIIYLLFIKRAREYGFFGIVTISVIFILLLLHGKSYYTQGVFPFLIAAGAVAWGEILHRKLTQALFAVVIIIVSIPFFPIGVPVFGQERLVKHFAHIVDKYGMDFVCRFEDNSIHSLPQDYADMLGWEELVAIADKGWKMIPDKNSAFIYCENYGQAGAVTVIGKKYGLPEAVCFSESFRYWIPEEFDPDIESALYINDELGDDVQAIFRDIRKVGSISNPHAREYGTTVWLLRDPAESFNSFWKMRIREL
ncbi:MAG: glycosyltransferase family 39 protein [Bacteroidales bacterium]|nr:glycosyltransferase family 39 protein [Bacteroidales bacterium]